VDAQALLDEGFDEVVLATGIEPRRVGFPGATHPKVCSYVDVLTGRVRVGPRAALVGAGGIGFDVAEFLCSRRPRLRSIRRAGSPNGACAPTSRVRAGWPVPMPSRRRGNCSCCSAARASRARSWARPPAGSTAPPLKAKGVVALAGVEYLGVEDAGLRIRVDGAERLLEVDHVVICAGQEPLREASGATPGRGEKNASGSAVRTWPQNWTPSGPSTRPPSGRFVMNAFV
jgi:2,4-dienoyl-CoA reductase (NADPH2)